jgi:hypothetical protein
MVGVKSLIGLSGNGGPKKLKKGEPNGLVRPDFKGLAYHDYTGQAYHYNSSSQVVVVRGPKGL